MATMGELMGKPQVHRYPPLGRPPFPYRWRSRQTEPERFGKACRIVPRVTYQRRPDGTTAGNYASFGSTEKILVEFEDGAQVLTTRGSLRRRKG